jgi:hypothetical protein
MQSYLLTALKSGVKSSRKGSKPSKSKIQARWKELMENPPTNQQYVRITKFLTVFYDGFAEEKADDFIDDLENIMLTDPSPVMKSYEYYLKIFKI